MKLSLLDYELPQERIAEEAEARGSARLLILRADGRTEEGHVRDFVREVPKDSVVVINDTRVFSARLLGHKAVSKGRVEIFLLEHEGREGDLEVFRAMGRASKGLKEGTELELERDGTSTPARILSSTGENFRVGIRALPGTIWSLLETIGHVPLPPYIQRADREDDRSRYQTVFADKPGAVAAPTAGLHFTEEMLTELRAKTEVVSLTLHVGLGTFQSVKVDDLDDHPMHEERVTVSPSVVETILRAKKQGRPIVAIGTTVVRALESAAKGGVLEPLEGPTRLLIQPGYTFNVVDSLFTNFHMPKSTLLALVSAFAGHERILAAYRDALSRNFRFLSYGDAMWIEKRNA